MENQEGQGKWDKPVWNFNEVKTCRTQYFTKRFFVSFSCRIIEFKDKDTARKAIETMHRYKMKDRNIVVREVNCIVDHKLRLFSPN